MFPSFLLFSAVVALVLGILFFLISKLLKRASRNLAEKFSLLSGMSWLYVVLAGLLGVYLL